jgi:hypothetical protein
LEVAGYILTWNYLEQEDGNMIKSIFLFFYFKMSKDCVCIQITFQDKVMYIIFYPENGGSK